MAGVVFALGFLTYFFYTYYEASNEDSKEISTIESTPINLKIKGQGQKLHSPENTLFELYVYESEYVTDDPEGIPLYKHAYFELKPENEDVYREIGLFGDTQKVVVIAPIFTITAYAEPGFYTYYRGECDVSCIESIPIGYEFPPTYESSANTIRVLILLGYPFLTDIEIDKHPNILKNFDKVIMLHNEYVTRTEFDAITNHPKVIYLHPNALYAEIEANYEENTITLIRGHNYPEPQIRNGFDWKFDNSQFEYDDCKEGWEFYEIDNGIMLNCYPENIIFKDKTLLKMIKEY